MKIKIISKCERVCNAWMCRVYDYYKWTHDKFWIIPKLRIKLINIWGRSAKLEIEVRITMNAPWWVCKGIIIASFFARVDIVCELLGALGTEFSTSLLVDGLFERTTLSLKLIELASFPDLLTWTLRHWQRALGSRSHLPIWAQSKWHIGKGIDSLFRDSELMARISLHILTHNNKSK